MVVISHDRYLIERIADNTYALFGDGRLTNLPGGIEEYLRRRQQMEAGAGRGPIDLGEKSPAGEDSADAADPTDVAGTAPAKRLSSQEEREITKKMNSLERKMAKLDAQTEKLNAQMAEAAEKMSSGEGDSATLAQLDADVKAVAGEREELEMEWLELGEKLEG